MTKRCSRFVRLIQGRSARGVVLALAVMPFLFLGYTGVRAQGETAARSESDVWKWAGSGLRVELEALSRDKAQAFFIGRGFSAKDADVITDTGCPFRSAIGNAGASAGAPDIEVRLKDWGVLADGKEKRPVTREDWEKVWIERGVEETSRTAFHWALFPSVQDHKPSDYNWGIITFGLPPGARFDLEMRWSVEGVAKSKILKSLRCGT